MNNEDQANTTDLDLKRLETRVDDLIQTVQSLSSENSDLRDKQKELVAERTELIEKTELARTRVEAMITRLKSMETNS
jgi:cell division protein ZapB